MKKLLTAVVCVLAVSIFAYGGWNEVGPFPDTTGNVHFQADGHGVTVDPDGKIWYLSYSTVDTFIIPGGGKDGADSVGRTRALYVWNPDGTPASFSPLKYVVWDDGTKDTLLWSGRGLRADNDGNIVVCNYDEARRINYQTGAGINKVTAIAAGVSTITPGFDEENNMYIGAVIPPQPIKVYDSEMGFITNITPSASGYSRCLIVSKDGKDVYWCGYSNNLVEIFHSDAGLDGAYVSTDTIKGISCEAIEWQPGTGYLWMGQSYSNLGDKKLGCFYALDITKKEWVDSIIVDFTGKTKEGKASNPRGIAFSPDGNICYVTFFSNPYMPIDAVYKYEKVSGIWQETGKFVVDYKLNQNFPNPFNPTTTIPFDLKNEGLVKLTVYDMLGREVATIVNEKLPAGSYNYKFDASGLASGMYIYRLDVNGQQAAKNMMYIK